MKKILTVTLALVCSLFLISNVFAADSAYGPPPVNGKNGNEVYFVLTNKTSYEYAVSATWEGKSDSFRLYGFGAPEYRYMRYFTLYNPGSSVCIWVTRNDGAVIYNGQCFPAGNLDITYALLSNKLAKK